MTQTELPPEAFAALSGPGARGNPTVVVATADVDGQPRTAPFGSLRALTPRLLRFGCGREHDTFANIVRDGRVAISLLTPPKTALTIRGRARVVKERMDVLEGDAVIEVTVEEVKDDSVAGTDFELASGVVVAYPEPVAQLVERYLAETER